MKLLSWLDIKRIIRKETDNFRHFPESIINIHFYPDEIAVEQRTEDVDAVKEAFKAWFPNPDIYNPEENRIYLDIGRLPLEISIEESSDEPIGFIERPRFDNLYFSKVFLSDESILDVPKPRNKFIAFHSFKGGVGRTLHLAAMIKSLSEIVKDKNEDKKIVVVDGDLEAPGITFWEKNRVGGTANIGFTQFLDAIQYADPETDYTEDAVIQYFAEEIQRFEHGIESTKIYVLPAFGDPIDLFQINVKPEHLSQDANPWKLRECLDKLATKIGADYVFIDLRAGISELSAPFLLDPYVDRFLVTTLSEQSLFGTELVLKEMIKLNRTKTGLQREMLPEIIISMVPPDLDEIRMINAKSRFEKTLFESDDESEPEPEDELLLDPISIHSTPFKTELLNIRSWEDVWDNSGSLIDFFKPYFQGLEDPDENDDDLVSGEDGPSSPLKKLQTFCSQYLFAENTNAEDFLTTKFFKEFPRQYFNVLPLVVSLGTKGAGKTFHFMRMAGFVTYKKFCDRIAPDKTGIDADFFPILRSTDIPGDSSVMMRLKENLPRFERFDYDQFKSSLEQFRDEKAHTESEWKNFWEKQIIAAVSEGNRAVTSFRQLNDQLKESPIIFLFDGLENIFPDIHFDKNHQNAVSALLDIPTRLSEIRDRKIGLVIFLRQDYLGSAKRQNSGQFQKKYESYQLLWNREDFLRLAYWIVIKSGALKENVNCDPSEMKPEQLEKELKKLWGMKLGKDNSKEANTINWVYGALSDFKGYLQARDVVRFLEEAAKISDKTVHTPWKDRLLPPSAIKRAMNGCSADRVNELKQESKVFESWANDLERMEGKEELVIPFSKSLLDDDDDDNRTLIELKQLGVVYEDTTDSAEEKRFYIPEIYRIGLGFKFNRGARPKVLSIKRKAVEKTVSIWN
ncbi:conserved hypothetical protein [Desulfamplus magnetovallimortis]|uniref:AAA domain-containing protein n=1 Tax=Desulfamplus magnetovallimortis TaxID=1246637 RepID=A0A1W1HGZ6_9BACT|nr:ParA family protein [Desulfamplus magnetovallimortis]SLM31716.1 conserved hypothetical protein [Desulfamplus magnetovallimortis]